MLGLNLEDVGKVVMGSDSTPPYDLQEICTSKSISKWAKWKPFKRTQVGAVTDEIRKSCGYGLSPINHDAPISYSGSLGSIAGDVGGIYQWIEDSLVTYRNNEGSDVKWDRPTKYYRLTDFSNYNQTDFYIGTERATYYLPEQNTYSPTLVYNAHQSSGSITLSDLEDIFDFDYFTNINYMEIALIYKYNGNYYIRRSNKTVSDLQQDQSSVSLQPYPFPTQVGSHVYEGFFIAIHSDELDYVFDKFGNPDYPDHYVEVIRFPDSYFKGTYVVKDPNILDYDDPIVSFNTEDYDRGYSRDNSRAAIYFDGCELIVRLQIKFNASKEDYSSGFVKVQAYYNGTERVEGKTILSEFGDPIEEYTYSVDVRIPADFNEDLGTVPMKVTYEIDHETYWVDLARASCRKSDPGYTLIKNIWGFSQI